MDHESRATAIVFCFSDAKFSHHPMMWCISGSLWGDDDYDELGVCPIQTEFFY
jgi:hypothetical protein